MRTVEPKNHTDESEAEEQGPFFITEKRGDNGRNLEVMSVSEIEDDPARQLVDGHFDTREEAETALRQGLASGRYSP